MYLIDTIQMVDFGAILVIAHEQLPILEASRLIFLEIDKQINNTFLLESF
jgi:hypothetical protein